MKKRKEIVVAWKFIEHRVGHFYKSILGIGKIAAVLGVSRGGIIPATMLMQHMNMESTEHTEVIMAMLKTVDPFVPGCFDRYAGDEGYLVLIDDIVDTGTTMEFFTFLLPL